MAIVFAGLIEVVEVVEVVVVAVVVFWAFAATAIVSVAHPSLSANVRAHGVKPSKHLRRFLRSILTAIQAHYATLISAHRLLTLKPVIVYLQWREFEATTRGVR